MADEEFRKIDYDKPISAETLLQLINSSIQSGNPLWLQRANLNGADLSEADLIRANLRGADLALADLGLACLLYAKYNAFTVWPEGFDPEAEGAKLVGD